MIRRRLALAAATATALIGVAACGVTVRAAELPDGEVTPTSEAPAPSADCASPGTVPPPVPSPEPGAGTITKPCAEPGQATPTDDAAQLPADFVGRWVSDGPVSQTPSTDPYTMTLHLRPGAAGDLVGDVSYPELGCSGQLTLVDAEPDEVTVTETITDDPGATCVPEGTIELTATAQGLDYAYTAASSAAVTGTAALVPA